MQLSPTQVGVGVGTSLIWAVDRTLPPGESLATRDYLVPGGGEGVEKSSPKFRSHDPVSCAPESMVWERD